MRAIPLISTLQQNNLLAAIPADSRKRLLSHLELVDLPQGKVLHEMGEPVRHAYFPIDAVIAIVAILENGDCTEVAMVGNEGMVGISSFLDGNAVPVRTIVRTSGHAYRMQGNWLHRELSRHAEMLAILLRYTQTLIAQTAQMAICNRHHSIDQQLCRVLLQFLDRVRGSEIEFTHETIATILGVRRESVTEAAGKLKSLGLIECYRGRLKILDRTGIEELSCECYDVVRKETERLLPPTAKLRRQG